MSYQINPDELEEIVDMGISHDQAVRALKLYKSKQAALDFLFPSPEKPIRPRTSLDDLNLAIHYSLKEQDLDYSLVDVSNPESQLRFDNSPVGLKNVKNTCYFNSLIQSYFMIPKLVQEVFSFKLDASHPNYSELQSSSNIKLIEELQLLFASMVLGNKKCINPSNVLDTLLDDSGNRVEVGEQKDIGEFNINFIARIEEGLKAVEEVKKETSLVSQLFYAKQQEFVIAKEADGEQVEFVNSTMFGQLSLDVNEKELHRAWDKAYHNFIEEYVTPRGHKTFATQDIWPEKLPGILLFQIQRVVYDPVLKISVKIDSEFKFPEVLYGDRYILKNKDVYLQRRDSVLNIRQKMTSLERQLNHIQNFKNSGHSIIQVLSSVTKFLDTQKYSILENKKKQINHLLDYPEDQIKETQSDLEKIKKSFELLETSLKQELDKLQLELETIFDTEDLKNYEYSLHSILMHQGRAEAGHYFAYIFDIEEKVWRRYSDTYIKKVTSQEVFKNAVGNEDMSAYCFIYIYKPYIENSGVFRGSLENLLENYSKIIPENIKQKVLESNDLFLYEIDSHKNLKIVEKIKTLYDERFTRYIQLTGDLSNTDRQLINFVIFIRLQRNEHLARLTLLQSCILEVTGKQLESFKNDLIFIAKLEDLMCKNHLGPNSLALSENDKTSLQELKVQFRRKHLHARFNMYIFEKMADDNLLQALAGLAFQLGFFSDPTDDYQKFCLENLKVIGLRMSSYVNACLYDKQIKEGLNWAKNLALVCCLLAGIDPEFNSFLRTQLEKSWNYLKKYIPGYFSVDVKQEFDKVFEDFNNLAALVALENERNDPLLKDIVESNDDEVQVLAWKEFSNTIAWNYVSSYKKYTSSFIYEWTIVLRRLADKNFVNTEEIISLERKNGIFNRYNW